MRSVALALALSCISAPAFADPPAERYSEYEQETLDEALARHSRPGARAKVEPSPEGKRIVAIEIDVLDVIEERDPAPNFLNYLHANTKDYVIERELLFDEGARWDSALIRESERNLRGLRQESLAMIVPLRGKEPGTVRALVIVKDVWSLRLNSDYLIQEGQLVRLFLQPAEENLAGTHRRALANFAYEPDTLTFGGRFVDPRLAGSRLAWTAGADVYVNKDSGDVEGGAGSFSYGKPLFSTREKWGWNASASYLREVTRSFVGLSLRTYDAAATPGVDAIPYVYDTEVMGGGVGVTRSYGVTVKNNFSFGASADRSVFRAPDLSAFDPAAVAEFEQEVVPFSEIRNGPFVSYTFYLNEYASLLDAETYGLQESYLLGPELLLRFQPISRAFGSTRDILVYTATAAYTQAIANGYARVYASADIETELAHADAVVTDSTLQAGLRLVTPPFYIGRLVYDGAVLYRPDNFSNNTVTLGGDGRLRGYDPRAFIGENLVVSNLEFRSRSFKLWTVLVGGVLFYDVGDVFDGDDIDPKQGAGFGVRVLLPQIGRAVIRADWGFALSQDSAPDSLFAGLLLTYRQAFGVPAATTRGVSLSASDN
jgi:hypothetical protein